MPAKNSRSRPSQTSLQLLPNLFTTAGLFSGFYSIIASYSQQVETAAIAILIAVICDVLDGRIARYLNCQTKFGDQYDNLADIVAFGLAPSLLAYNWQLEQLGHVGVLICFIYLFLGSVRLAKFTSQQEYKYRTFFHGLPIPVGAGLIASLVWSGTNSSYLLHAHLPTILASLLIMLSLLMISNFRYVSFKQHQMDSPSSLLQLALVVLAVLILAVRPAEVLLFIFFIYVFHGPVLTAIKSKGLQIEHIIDDNKDADFEPEPEKKQSQQSDK